MDRAKHLPFKNLTGNKKRMEGELDDGLIKRH
jgi:hypothetical protein